MSSAGQGRGGIPPRGPGRGHGGRGPNGSPPRKKRKAVQKNGRPLQPMERQMVMGVWYQLSVVARRDLVQRLTEMIGETPSLVAQASNLEPDSNQGQQQAPRVKPWERDIIRDVPLFQEFGQMTTLQRKNDSTIPSRMSIVMGVIKRGKTSGISDENILAQILANIDDADSLKQLFIAVTNEASDAVVKDSHKGPPPPKGGTGASADADPGGVANMNISNPKSR
jgi:hypothetical protein